MQRRIILIATLMFAAAAALAARDDSPKDGFFTTSDGVKIHYLTLGSKGSWVVLIHGYTGNAEHNWFSNGIAAAGEKSPRRGAR